MRNAQRTHRHGHSGFTLVELVITVVVIAILAAVAFPTFMGSIRKSRRAEAFNAVTAIQQAQERWRGSHPGYTSGLTADLGIDPTTAGGRYTVSLANVGPNTYEAIATAVSGSSQADDGDCAKLGVKMVGGTLSYAGAGASGTLTYTPAHACWNR